MDKQNHSWVVLFVVGATLAIGTGVSVADQSNDESDTTPDCPPAVEQAAFAAPSPISLKNEDDEEDDGIEEALPGLIVASNEDDTEEIDDPDDVDQSDDADCCLWAQIVDNDEDEAEDGEEEELHRSLFVDAQDEDGDDEEGDEQEQEAA